MTYVDTTLTPEAGYIYVNGRQIYDVVAGAMTTNPAWDYVEYVDAINAPNTYRRYVWKCNAAQSGLSADFFVVFQVAFTTATGPVTGWHVNTSVRVWMGETYSGGVLGKFATNGVSVTLASDLTNPATFTLSTYASPASLWDTTNTFGTMSNNSSFRYCVLVAKDALVLTKAGNSTGNPDSAASLYVGAYERVLSAAVDPLPIVVLGTTQQASPYPGGAGTRAPTMTPATAYTEVFSASSVTGTPAANSGLGAITGWATYYLSWNGSLGDPANTNWAKSSGGVLVSRLVVWAGCALTSRSTKGIFRGYLKYMGGVPYAAHSYGDTFLIEGRVYVGNGTGLSGALIDTEAV